MNRNVLVISYVLNLSGKLQDKTKWIFATVLYVKAIFVARVRVFPVYSNVKCMYVYMAVNINKWIYGYMEIQIYG